jgi:transketolase
MSCADLEKTARALRLDALEMIYDVKDGHPGPAFSVAEIVTALYFGGIMQYDPKNPEWEDRDRFILSKGHACPIVYAALIRLGVIPEAEKLTLRKINSRLQGHPALGKTPGIEAVTGALGNGLAMAVGLAKGLKIQKKQSHVFVIVGDGELEEGICWEAIQAAVGLHLDNLFIFVDHNGWQSGGTLESVSGILPLNEKLTAFQTDVRTIDGHDFRQILTAYQEAKEIDDRPHVILCHTVKGRGVDFMEDDNSWHKRVPTPEQYEQAQIQLRESE